ncbi:MAG: arsenite methyltransferase [Thermoplasmata archaeon]|nr:arsenite methyltransferase [Thermoplasmata archaeon]
MEKKKIIIKAVKDHYGQIASKDDPCDCGTSCCGSGDDLDAETIAKQVGYSDEELANVPEANLGLGCGNPTALGEIREGEVVVDLGSGAGIDCFLASKKVGSGGKVIGIDMTPEMLARATETAERYNITNVEFRKGFIDAMPVDDNSVDVIISNCVINLAPDKNAVFKDAYRILKTGGRLYISDIVLTEELAQEHKENYELYVGCVAGAVLLDDYLGLVKDAGFTIRSTDYNKEISRQQYNGMPVTSLKLVAIKQ